MNGTTNSLPYLAFSQNFQFLSNFKYFSKMLSVLRRRKKRSEQRLRLKYLEIVFCALDSHELRLNSIYYN